MLEKLRSNALFLRAEERHFLSLHIYAPRPESLPVLSTFIPSTVFDNHYLMENNPEYLKNLQSLPTLFLVLNYLKLPLFYTSADLLDLPEYLLGGRHDAAGASEEGNGTAATGGNLNVINHLTH